MPSPVIPSSLVLSGDDSIPSGGTAPYSAYVLYSDGHRGDTPVSPTWSVSSGSVSRTGVVTAPVVSANTEITLSANTTAEGVHVTGTKAVTVTAAIPAVTSNLRVVSATAADGISLAWDSVPGASGYTVSRTADGAAEATFQTSAASYTDATAFPGVLYSYRVTAVNAAGAGAQSAVVTARIPVAAPTGVKATCDRTDCVRVTWNAVAGATHYLVRRELISGGSVTGVGDGWTASLSLDDTTAEDNVFYIYSVRAATSASGANASGFSIGVQGRKKPARTLQSLAIAGPDRVPASGEAVYSCTASYSDNTTETVSPSWSVSPVSAGTIRADGRFAAAAVQADVTATITASFGGATPATKSVLVVAPTPTTAEITSVSAAQRWPFSGLVDIDYTLATTPAGTKASVSVSATDEDHNVALPATTLSGDGATGAVEAGSHRITWDLAADHPGFHAASLRVDVSAVPASLAAPVVTATAGGTNVKRIDLSWNAVQGATQYEVLRGISADITSATTLATMSATTYPDTSVQFRPTYSYWVVARNGSLSAASERVEAHCDCDLMPLMSMLKNIESLDPDGILSDRELDIAMRNPTRSDMDGDKNTISPDEMDVFTRIQALNEDKALISAVMRGDLTYAGMTDSILDELVAISDKIKVLRDSATFVPKNVAATQGNASTTPLVTVSWTRPATVETVLRYEVYRATTTNGTQELVATVTTTNYADTAVTFRQGYWYRVKAVYDSKTSNFSAQAKGYWGDWCIPEDTDLMPLMSVLKNIESFDPDGILSDMELHMAMRNPGNADMDGDNNAISPDEMDVFTRIQTLNQDKALISAVMRGDLTYAGMTFANLVELQSISDSIRLLRDGEDYPTHLSATQGNASTTPLVTVSWRAPSKNETVLRYEVYRATSTNGTPELVATVMTTNYADTAVTFRHGYWYRVKAVYDSKTSNFSAQAKGYWGDWCIPEDTNLMPLMSLLNNIESFDPDGIVSDMELAIAMGNPGKADMDGDKTVISPDEMDVFTRIQTLNQDKALISAVMRGDLTYAGMTFANLVELQSISDSIRLLRN